MSLRRTGLTTECEGEVGTLRPIRLNSPKPTPALNGGKVVLEGLGNGVTIIIKFIYFYISRMIKSCK